MDVAHPFKAVCPSLDGEVLNVLAGTTRGLTGREVALLTGRRSHSGVLAVLNRLTEHGLVTRVELNRAFLFSANRDHLAWPAVETLRRALAKTRSPALITPAGIIAFLAQPAASPGEWQARADRVVKAQGNPGNVDYLLGSRILGYALILGKHYAAAGPVLEALYRAAPTTESDDGRMLLGLAKLRAGNKAEAASLLERYPLPPREITVSGSSP